MSDEGLQKRFKHLQKLTTLLSRAEEFEALCLPDFVPDLSSGPSFAFSVISAEDSMITREITGVALDDPNIDIVGMGIGTDRYILTDWARSQLLTHLGTREKWFWPVSDLQQAEELNARLETFNGHRLRLMRTEESDIGVIRGLVSRQYAEIKDTEALEALLSHMPDGMVLPGFSGKTDRALYAYVVSENKIGIPGTALSEAYPGVILKNSEVGYTSLWLIPHLWFPAISSTLVFEKRHVYRRIHRGNVDDLKESFEAALNEAAEQWTDLESRLERLGAIHYADEDRAVEVMRAVLRGVGATKAFTHLCVLSYKSAQHTSHDAARIVEAILDRVRTRTDEDERHVHASIAGAALLRLVPDV